MRVRLAGVALAAGVLGSLAPAAQADPAQSPLNCHEVIVKVCNLCIDEWVNGIHVYFCPMP